MEFYCNTGGMVRWISTSGELPAPRLFILCPEPAARDLYDNVETPGGARGDSGTDLRFAEDVVIPPTASMGGLPVTIGLKVRARSYESGACVFTPYEIRPRSSIAKTPLGLANSVGTIDQGYTGELKLAIRNYSAEPFRVERGTSLFQLVRPDLKPAAVAVVAPDSLIFRESVSARGAGGFGSTGVAGAGAAGPGLGAEK